jgi:predicted PurR-regulated permease PerM
MLKTPGLARINTILLFTILISIILYFGKEFFVLITFSGLFAMLMAPVSNGFENHHISRVISSVLSVLIIAAVLSVVVVLLSAQVANISQEMPQIRSGLERLISDVQYWIYNSIGVSSEQLKDQVSGVLSGLGSFLTGMVKGIFTFIGRFILVMVFTFLFLLHRDKYVTIVEMLYKDRERDEIKELVGKISKIAQQYLAGRLVAAFLMCILFIIGFSIIGLKNAILLSTIAAFVTIIPYVGGLIGGLVPLLMTVISSSYNQALLVVVVILLVNVLDHYYIEPYIVGGSVNISPFFTILILILGGILWGLSGIILFLPLLGILKIVFENVEGLQPYAYMIGNQRESTTHEKIWLKLKELFSRRKNRN